jgi:hypothetical protein
MVLLLCCWGWKIEAVLDVCVCGGGGRFLLGTCGEGEWEEGWGGGGRGQRIGWNGLDWM